MMNALAELQDSPPTPKAVLELLHDLLAPAPGYLRVSEVTAQYPFVRRHRLFVGSNERRQSASVALLSESEPPKALSLTGGAEALSELLVGETGSLPNGLTPEQLAMAVRRLGVDPSGFLGNPDVLKRMIPPSPQFCDGDAAEQQKKRRNFAEPPQVTRHEGGYWTLQFFYWTPLGGVELWNVSGDETQILGAQRSEATAPGSFRWPFR